MSEIDNNKFKYYQDLLGKIKLKKRDLIMPVFVDSDFQLMQSAESQLGLSKIPLSYLVEHTDKASKLGIVSIIIFGVPEKRDINGLEAANKNGIVPQAVKTLRQNFGKSINIITDVCLCQYNLSGHCGLLNYDNNKSNSVDNDRTLSILNDVALSHASAGADVVAPSSMMDGQVKSIRRALDDHGHKRTKILSYSAKHTSSLYRPFRSVAFYKDIPIDKSEYQVSFCNPKAAMMEIESDIKEGADGVMIKPAIAYLDLIYRTKKHYKVPLTVQNVSGEYAMIRAAAIHGALDETDWKIKLIASIKRAGADRIISYFALDMVKYLDN